MNKDALIIREMTPADRPFVVASWLQSYWKTTEIAFPVYRVGQTALIEGLIIPPHKPPLIAAVASLPDEIAGWVCHAAPGIAHYVYVKQAYRRLGIGTMLATLWGDLRQHSHETRAGRLLAGKLHSVFNPYLLNPITAGLVYPQKV